ncbi:filamentous hemagglutinin N-terminal domain-containing protein [Lusitaniella coriacea LEGE 07157]|uniref:Filamentous hemagglutinin N-terminal domain-containing protein n=1 Tax=Lusitaniella coriacea LEGE 07157 TaxID=945747 RepID=A0A8J7B8T4_9CYAN|nr:filamentous hemagglutinin N-terminal domain-containing protein [Lusitaniella coriacea]MBE9115108.1 filamentous hemagglutinin N-terminal domain-containing protein [Lusitaniella coriacea LEGE 07157]
MIQWGNLVKINRLNHALSILFPQVIRFFFVGLSTLEANAQIVPDGTLRNNSTANLLGPQWIITGGKTIGNNLFHSFNAFNVGTGEIAFFNNAATLQNIIARVTGGTSSTIDGLIRANGVANLFLINPNGIIFGANAQLGIGGSFFASTADSVVFSDRSSFSATNPQAAPLLAVNVPMGLQMGTNPSNIAVNAQNLQAFPGRTIGFIGGNLQLNNAQVRAFQGRVELGSVGANSLVRLTPNTTNIAASYEGVSNFQDIQLSNAFFDVSGLGGGTIQVQGRNVAVGNGSTLASRTFGSEAGGDIILRGSESVSITGDNPSRFTGIALDTLGTGTGGNAIVETEQFLLQGTANIALSSLNSGAGGNLTIRASEQATIVGLGLDALEQFLDIAFSGQFTLGTPVAGLFAIAAADGQSGDITIETGSLSLQNGALFANATFGQASSGNINIRTTSSMEVVGSAVLNAATFGSQGSAGKTEIDTSQLTVRDGGLISTITFGNEPSGDIAITASDFVELNRTLPNAIFPTGITNNSFGVGAGGDVKIATGRFINRDGAVVIATSGGILGTGFVPFGGPGGNISIEARESVEITGSAANRFAGQAGGELVGGPGTTTSTSFPAGDLTIRTRRLTLADGAFVDSATLSSGNGGNLLVEASESVELIGRSSLTGFPTSITTSSGRPDFSQTVVTGNGGNLTLRTKSLALRDGATLDMRSFGVGDAGTLDITAHSIFLDRGSSFNASTVSGAGGNINLNAKLILLRRGSNITTDAGNTDGGNIFINANNLVAVLTEDSDISANSRNSRGGNITINVSGGIFGLRFQEEDTPLSDITATGRDSSQSGTVTINTVEINPAENLEKLALDFADPSQQIATGCAAYAQSRFEVIGRGGLPEDPTVMLPGQTVWRDLQAFSSSTTNAEESVSLQEINTSRPLVEANSWRVNKAGNVELVTVLPSKMAKAGITGCAAEY